MTMQTRGQPMPSSILKPPDCTAARDSLSSHTVMVPVGGDVAILSVPNTNGG